MKRAIITGATGALEHVWVPREELAKQMFIPMLKEE